MPTKKNGQAPAFDLESDSGKSVTLEDFAGKWLVLYFYPKDNTPGCTREAQEFAAATSRLERLGAEVVGVSRDMGQTHCRFKAKFGLLFPLLSDPGLVAHKAYGAWGTKTMYGKTVEGVVRSTFLIAPDGSIAHKWSGVKVEGHVEKVIATIEKARLIASTESSGTYAKNSRS